MIRIGVLGYGYWGPNIVRNLRGVEGCRVAMVCDKRAAALTRLKQAYPDQAVTADPSELLESTQIDAVAVVTPVGTHFEIAKAALQNGKHVFIEKPFTATTQQAEELIELAERKNLRIMVDHTFLFTGAVRKMRQLIDAGVSADRIHVAPLCTMDCTDLFFSYRRDKQVHGRVGRLMSVIGRSNEI